MRKKSYYKCVLCGTVTADTHCFEEKRNVRYGYQKELFVEKRLLRNQYMRRLLL